MLIDPETVPPPPMGRSGFPIAALGAALGAAAAFWLWKESQPTSPEPAIKPMHKPAPLVDEEKDQVSGQSEAEVPQQPEKTISRLTRNFSVSPDAIISGFESLFEGIAHSSQEHRLFKTIEDVAAPAPAAAAVSLSSTNDEESAQVEKAKSLIEDEFSRIISTLESEFERKVCQCTGWRLTLLLAFSCIAGTATTASGETYC